MSLLDWVNPVKGIIGEAAEAIDRLHVNKVEKAEALAKLHEVENAITREALNIERDVGAMRRDVIVAETQSDSWLTRSWRPLVVCTFASLIPAAYVTVLVGGDPEAIGRALSAVPSHVWTLITVAIGGYIPMRTIDKAVKSSNGAGLVGALFGKGKRRGDVGP